MKKTGLIQSLALSCIILFSSLPASAVTKVDPLITMMAKKPSLALSSMKAFGVKAVGETVMTDVFIKVRDVSTVSYVGDWIDYFGGKTRTVVGTVMTASIPLDSVTDIAGLSDVVYIEAAKPVRLMMNAARGFTKVDQVQNGGGADYTGSAYKGSGVIVGVVDSGIDCEHADFTGRILAYWDQDISGDGVSEIAGSSGKEYTGAALTDGSCAGSPDGSDAGHGTHVAGIAAGADATFKGVAPEANLVIVKLAEPALVDGTYGSYVISLSTYAADAVNYIFRKAQGLKRPAVVNLSIGTSLGAHDGTSLFESLLDGLLIESGSTEKEGRAIVGAAGNENAQILASGGDTNAGGIHATVSVSASQPKAFQIQTSSGGGVDPVAQLGGTWIDIWLNSSSSCTIGINAFKSGTLKKEMTPVAKGESNEGSPAGDGVVSMYVNFTDQSNALNGKQHAVGRITASASSAMSQYTFDLVFNGTCTGDAWLYYDNVSYNIFTKAGTKIGTNALGYQYVDGDSNRTMTIPATANKIIAVGSFMGRATWIDMNGVTRSQTSVTGGAASGLSTFSSLGPSADGRYKPDLAAPGEPIISTMASTISVSASNKGDATHYKQQGSSMASPHVAGMVALILQKNGCIKPSDIKNALTTYADTDGYTGAVPNNSWGYGKLNAADAVSSVTAASCAPNNPSEEGSAGSCTTSDDCETGKVCINSVCTTASCISDADCQSGETCTNGSCASGSSSSKACALVRSYGRTAIKSNELMPVFVAFLVVFCLILSLHGAKAYKKGRSK